MEYALKQIVRFEDCEWSISDWLRHFSKRCVTAKVTDDTEKVNLCSLYIGSAGETVLDAIPAGASWAEVEETLIQEIGRGSAAEEAYETLRTLKRKDKSILEIGKLCERLAKVAYPSQPELQERHGREAFLRALSPTLAAKLQQFGYTQLPDLVKAARRIEEYPLEPSTPPSVLGDLTARLKALEQQTSHLTKASPPPLTVHHTTTQEDTRPRATPPGFSPSPNLPQRPHYRYSFKEHPPPSQRHYRRGPRTTNRLYNRGPYQPGGPRPPLRCFLCDELGHIVAQCPWRTQVRDLRSTTPHPAPSPPAQPENGPLLQDDPPLPASGTLN